MVTLVRSATHALAGAGEGVRKILRYRDLLRQMVATELRGRYLGSLLGGLWAFIHPLVLLGIYLLVFSRLMGARLGERSDSPYAFGIYLCAGLLPWTLFAEVVARSTGILIERAALVKKMAFPNLLLHLYVTGSAAFQTALMVALLGLALALAGELPPAAHGIAWLALLILQLVLAVGLGLMASTLNVFFRDVGQAVAVILQIWFWLTPIVYVPQVLPAAAAEVLRANPLSWYAAAQQQALLGEALPGVALFSGLVLCSLLALAAGLLCYAALRHQIPDEL